MFREGSDLVRQAANFAPGQLPRVQFAECADMECLLLRVEQTCSERQPMTALAQSGHQEVELSGCSARTRSGLTGSLFIRNSIASSGVSPRPRAAKSQVQQIQASPAMTRCRFASDPLDCA